MPQKEVPVQPIFPKKEYAKSGKSSCADSCKVEIPLGIMSSLQKGRNGSKGSKGMDQGSKENVGKSKSSSQRHSATSSSTKNVQFIDAEGHSQPAGDSPVPHGKAGRDEITDETVRLFNAMPKGLEHFLSNGPPKMVKDRCDFAALEQQHARQLVERKTQEPEILARWLAVMAKEEALKRDIMAFDGQQEELHKRQITAKSKYVQEAKAIRVADKQLVEMKAAIASLLQRKEKLHNILQRYHKFQDFITNTEKKSHFKNFIDLMKRHETLMANLKSMIDEDKRGQLESLESELGSIKAEHFNTSLDFTVEETRLRKYRDELVMSNNALTTVVDNRQNNLQQLLADQMTMVTGITNMTKLFMSQRPYAGYRLKTAGNDPAAQLQIIGELLIEYGDIVPHAKKLVELDPEPAQAVKPVFNRAPRKSIFSSQSKDAIRKVTSATEGFRKVSVFEDSDRKPSIHEVQIKRISVQTQTPDSTQRTSRSSHSDGERRSSLKFHLNRLSIGTLRDSRLSTGTLRDSAMSAAASTASTIIEGHKRVTKDITGKRLRVWENIDDHIKGKETKEKTVYHGDKRRTVFR